MNEIDLKILKIMVDTNSTLYEAKRANMTRLKTIDGITMSGYEHIKNITVDSINESLQLLRKEIYDQLLYFPEYYDCLKKIDKLSVYESAELIVLIKDIKRFKNRKAFIYYCGLSPVIKMGKNYQKITNKNKNYGEVIGNPRQDTTDIQYNDRLNRLILKIIYKLIKKNGIYKVMYNDYYEDYYFRHPNYSKKHLENMAKRKVAVRFIKFIYKEFNRIESENNDISEK